MSRADLIDITKSVLGEHADRLLSNGDIVPIKANKAPLVRFKDGVDPKRKYAFTSLAVRTGPTSGLTVLDHDAETPAEANVHTNRGGHVWVAWEGDRNRNGVAYKIDRKGYNGYAIFYGPNYQVQHLDLHPRTPYLKLLEPTRSSRSSTASCVKGAVWECVPLSTPRDYKRKVEDQGYRIDVEWATKALVSQVRSAEEGSRNIRFYRNLCAVMLIGGDVKQVLYAAEDCGLEMGEIQATYASALDNPRGVDVFDLAYGWLARAKGVLDSPLADEVVKAAIQQHSMRPQFNEQASDMPRATLRRHYSKYEDAGVLKKFIPSGRQTNGKSWPNNWLLMPEIQEGS